MLWIIVLVLFFLFCIFIFLPLCFLKELTKRSPYSHKQQERLIQKGKCLDCARSEFWTGNKCRVHRK